MKRPVSFLVAEIFVFTSLSFAWAHPADSLRPRVAAQGHLRQELEKAATAFIRQDLWRTTAVKDGGEKKPLSEAEKRERSRQGLKLLRRFRQKGDEEALEALTVLYEKDARRYPWSQNLYGGYLRKALGRGEVTKQQYYHTVRFALQRAAREFQLGKGRKDFFNYAKYFVIQDVRNLLGLPPVRVLTIRGAFKKLRKKLEREPTLLEIQDYLGIELQTAIGLRFGPQTEGAQRPTSLQKQQVAAGDLEGLPAPSSSSPLHLLERLEKEKLDAKRLKDILSLPQLTEKQRIVLRERLKPEPLTLVQIGKDVLNGASREAVRQLEERALRTILIYHYRYGRGVVEAFFKKAKANRKAEWAKRAQWRQFILNDAEGEIPEPLEGDSASMFMTREQEYIFKFPRFNSLQNRKKRYAVEEKGRGWFILNVSLADTGEAVARRYYEVQKGKAVSGPRIYVWETVESFRLRIARQEAFGKWIEEGRKMPYPKPVPGRLNAGGQIRFGLHRHAKGSIILSGSPKRALEEVHYAPLESKADRIIVGLFLGREEDAGKEIKRFAFSIKEGEFIGLHSLRTKGASRDGGRHKEMDEGELYKLGIEALGELEEQDARDGGRAQREIRKILDGDEEVNGSHGLEQVQKLLYLTLHAKTFGEVDAYLDTLDVPKTEKKAQRWIAEGLSYYRTPWPQLIQAIRSKRNKRYFYIWEGPLVRWHLKRLLVAANHHELALLRHRIDGKEFWLISLGTSDRTDPMGVASVHSSDCFMLSHSLILDIHSHPIGNDVAHSDDDLKAAEDVASSEVPSVVVALDKNRKLISDINRRWGEHQRYRWGKKPFYQEDRAIRELRKVGWDLVPKRRPSHGTVARKRNRQAGDGGRARDGGERTDLRLQTSDIPSSLSQSLETDRAPQLLLPTFP